MLKKAEELGSASFEALAMWIGLAVSIKYQYAAILKNSLEPGVFPRDMIEKFRTNLKEMHERHRSWIDH